MNLTIWLTRLRNKLQGPQPHLPQVRIRFATEEDRDPIVALVQHEARQGHFHSLLATDDGRFGLGVQLLCLIKRRIYPRPPSDDQPWTLKLLVTADQELAVQGDFDSCYGCAEVIEVDQQFAGFHIWYVLPPENEQQAVEYYFLAVLPEYRRRGYAKLLVNHALHTIPSELPITARCYPRSEILYQYLLRQGFILQGVTPQGTRNLYLPPR